MKQLLITWFILIFAYQTEAQTIHLNQLDKDFTSYLPKSEQLYIDSVLNTNVFTISLVSLKPECDSQGQCHEESAIIDDFNWDTPVDDSTFGTSYLRRIRTELFDSIVRLDTNDYGIVLSEILMGEAPYDGIRIIDICYNPRHAIIVQDEEERILGIYEICFECSRSKVAFSIVEPINDSSGLSRLFVKHGLVLPK